jgi:hypothetical protein
MNVVQQLYQLQEVELEIEANEPAIQQIASQLGESSAVVGAQAKLAEERQQQDRLLEQQRSGEWEIDNLSSKLTAVEKKLYSGEVKNPKELSSLQQDRAYLKAKKSKLEDRVLEIMDQVELAKANISTAAHELKSLEAEWRQQQQQLSAQMEQTRAQLAKLEQKREPLRTGIDPPAIALYDKLRKERGTAVAKIEQGRCCGCRISLSTTELQRARGNKLVQCSNCGRILFLS